MRFPFIDAATLRAAIIAKQRREAMRRLVKVEPIVVCFASAGA